MKQVIIGFGLLIFALLALFRLARFSQLQYNTSAEYWVAGFSIVFFVIGVWLSRRLFRKEIVKEKTIYVDTALPLDPDEKQLERSGLSKREFEILQLINEGLSNQQMAEKLFLSESTIKKHVSNIFLKLDVERRTEAIKKGKEMRIIR